MDFWPAISAIAALLGSFWAIYIFFIRRKKKISVELATMGRRSDESVVYIIIHNNSEIQITIVRILIREKGHDLVELSNQNFDLPNTILANQHMTLVSPYLAHNLEKVVEIYAEDNLGKRWKVRNQSIKQSIKILQNFIGNRLIYPTMDDELDENKIKGA